MSYMCMQCNRLNLDGDVCECRRFKQDAAALCTKSREHHEQLLQDAREKEMASLSCPDCARLRALLGEAIKLLEDAGTAVGTKHTALESKCFALAARIAKELEETK